MARPRQTINLAVGTTSETEVDIRDWEYIEGAYGHPPNIRNT